MRFSVLYIVFFLGSLVWVAEAAPLAERAVGARTAQINLTSYQKVPASPDAVLGRGFKGLEADWIGDCIDPKGIPDVKGAVKDAATSVSYDLKYVENSEHFRRLFNLSAAGSVGLGAFSGDASVKIFRESMNTSTSHYLLLKVDVKTQPVQIAKGQLTSDAENLLRRSPNTFYRTCGNYYASAVEYGGSLAILLEISTRNDREFESTGADLKASVAGFGSGTASLQQSLEKISRTYSVSGKLVRNGLNEAIPDMRPEILVPYAQNFPKKLVDTGLVVPYEYSLSDYQGTLQRSGLIAPSYRTEEVQLERLCQLFGVALEATRTVEYAQQNLHEFFPTPAISQLVNLKQSISNTSHAIEDQIIACGENPTKGCRVALEKMEIPELSLPRRVPWITFDPRQNDFTIIGVVPSGQNRRIRVMGEYQRWGNAPWYSADGSTQIRIRDTSGQVTDQPYDPALVVTGGSEISARIDDGVREDNTQSPTNPSRAALY